MLEEVKAIAKEAGQLAKSMRATAEVTIKAEVEEDYDPVTDADKAAEKLLREKLTALRDYPILSEETPERFNMRQKVWIVDPIDGTREYVTDGDTYCVLIGLCDNGEPTLGVAYLPEKDLFYYATKNGGAWKEHNGKKEKLQVSSTGTLEDSTVMKKWYIGGKGADRSWTDNYPGTVIGQNEGELPTFALIAEGRLDASFTIGVPGKWDTCAPGLIIHEAGGEESDMYGKPIDYLNDDFMLYDNTIVCNSALFEKFVAYIENYIMK